MALLVRIEHELTSSSVNPTCGPVVVTSALSSLVILALCTDAHLFLWKTLAKGGVDGGTVVSKI